MDIVYWLVCQLSTNRGIGQCQQLFQGNSAPLEKRSSSDPHPDTPFWHSFWHTIWKYTCYMQYIYIYSDILSGILSGMSSGPWPTASEAGRGDEEEKEAEWDQAKFGFSEQS